VKAQLAAVLTTLQKSALQQVPLAVALIRQRVCCSALVRLVPKGHGAGCHGRIMSWFLEAERVGLPTAGVYPPKAMGHRYPRRMRYVRYMCARKSEKLE
jgi:hypothetical protein